MITRLSMTSVYESVFARAVLARSDKAFAVSKAASKATFAVSNTMFAASKAAFAVFQARPKFEFALKDCAIKFALSYMVVVISVFESTAFIKLPEDINWLLMLIIKLLLVDKISADMFAAVNDAAFVVSKAATASVFVSPDCTIS